jgi:hypothetical protein
VSNYLNWIVRNSTELEMMMNAVERVDEYTQLKTETTEDGKQSSCFSYLTLSHFTMLILPYYYP